MLLDDDTYVIKTLDDIHAMSEPVTDFLSGKKPSPFPGTTNHLKTKYKNREFFYEFGEFQKRLSDPKLFLVANKDKLNYYHGVLHLLLEEYDEFTKKYDQQQAIAVILAGVEVFNTVHSLKQSMEATRNALISIPDKEVDPNKERLTILLDSALNLREFALNIEIISDMYSELCMIMKVSEAENPLKIRKIESGSEWLDVLGHKKVINTLTKWIEECVSYYYMNYTKEGNRNALAKNLREDIKLKGILEKIGISSEGMDEHIQKSAITLSHKTFELAEKSSLIEINGTRFQHPEYANMKLLGGGNKAKLISEQPQSDEKEDK